MEKGKDVKISKCFILALIGISIIAIGVIPLLIFVYLQEQKGLFPGNNALGLGLLFWFTLFIGTLFIISSLVCVTLKIINFIIKKLPFRKRTAPKQKE